MTQTGLSALRPREHKAVVLFQFCPGTELRAQLVQELTQGLMADRVVLTPSVLHAELLATAMALTARAAPA